MSVFSKDRDLKLFIIVLAFCVFTQVFSQQNDSEHAKKAGDKKQQVFLDKRMHGGDNSPFRELYATLSEQEKAELKKLQQENPEAFREKLKQKIQALKQKKNEENSKLKSLSKKYQEASLPEEKQQVLKQIREITEKQFDQKMETNRKALENIEKRFAELKKKYEEREQKRSEIIESRVLELTKDPSLEW